MLEIFVNPLVAFLEYGEARLLGIRNRQWFSYARRVHPGKQFPHRMFADQAFHQRLTVNWSA